MKAGTGFILSTMCVGALCLSGCKDQSEASAVLPTMCQYFPDSAIFKFDKRVLWIQTHVDGISRKVAADIYEQACQEAAKSIGKIKINIATELQFDGRSILVIGFNHGCVACDLRDGVDANGVPRGTVMNWQEAHEWFTQHIGYMPSADKILVVRLADVQNTPKGQEMQLETLAQIQLEKKEKMQQELQQELSQ